MDAARCMRSVASRSSRPLIAEVFGGLAPHGYRFLTQLSRVAAEHAARDTTKYTKCAASYLTYHSQRARSASCMHAIDCHDGRTQYHARDPPPEEDCVRPPPRSVSAALASA